MEAGRGVAIWEVAARHALAPYRTWIHTYNGYEDALQDARLLAWQIWKNHPNAQDPVAYLITATRRSAARAAASDHRYWSNRLDLDDIPTDSAALVEPLDCWWATLVPADRTLLEHRADGASWQECGEAIGVSRQAARQRYLRIRKRLEEE